MNWFNAPAHWYVIGFAGQLCFGSRFLVQWIASERSRRVVIPPAFWYLSVAGGLAMLTYAVLKHDPVFVIGQCAGLVVYVRNLILHRGDESRRT